MVRFVTNNFRLVATLLLTAIAAALVFLGPGHIEVAYNPNTLTAEQTVKQQELLVEYAARVDVVSVDGNKRYIFSDGRWSDNRPSYLDENDQPLLSEFDKTEIAEQVTTPIPVWMFAGNQLSIDEYNLLLNSTKAAIWVVFLSTFFWCLLIDYKPQSRSIGGALFEGGGLVMMAIFPFLGVALVIWLSTRVVQPALPIATYLLFALPFIWLYRNELRGMINPSPDNESAPIKVSCDAKTC